jgi:hypothetical protein
LRGKAVQPRSTGGAQRAPVWASGAVGLVLAGALVAGAGGVWADPKPSSRNVQLAPIAVTAQPIAAFDKIDPERTRFGKLTWRGGLVLTSPSPNFGGWSGLALGPDGKSFLSISDAGTWMSGRLVYDKGRPTGMDGVRLGPLLSLDGETIARSRDRDAEGLSLLSGTPAKGSMLVSFEHNHRIWRYDVDAKGLSAARSYVALPAAIKRLPGNSGLEAVTVLRGGPYKGSLVVFAESLHDSAGNNTGWIWVKGRAQEFHLSNAGDYAVTDAAPLADGSLLVLERRFRWSEGVKVRLRLIRRAQLRPGAKIDGETLLDASMNQEIDNMEGLAVNAGAGGEIIVTMISDDNFNKALQRTLLLQFALDGADLASTGTRP